MRGMKFDVRKYDNQEFKALQQELLNLGYLWGDSRKRIIQDKTASDNFLYANTDGVIRRGSTEEFFVNHANNLEAVDCLIEKEVKITIPKPVVKTIEIAGKRYDQRQVEWAIQQIGLMEMTE